MATSNFDHIYSKFIEIGLLAFLNSHQHAKNPFNPSTHSWDTVNFRVIWPGWPHSFLTTPTPKVFDKLLIYVSLYQHVKNLFWRYGWLKNLQTDWLRTFWPITQGQKIFQIRDLCRNTVGNINFNYRTNSVKINDQIFQ